jgi:hypothetical protein
MSATNTVTAHMIGQIGNGFPDMPVTLPGVTVRLRNDKAEETIHGTTDAAGTVRFPGVTFGQDYIATVLFGEDVAGTPASSEAHITFYDQKSEPEITVNLPLLTFTWSLRDEVPTKVVPRVAFPYGKSVYLTLSERNIFEPEAGVISTISANGIDAPRRGDVDSHTRTYTTYGSNTGSLAIRVAIGMMAPASNTPVTVEAGVLPQEPGTIEGAISVGMRRTTSRYTQDMPLWVSIRKGTDALGFDRYFDFMNWIFCNDARLDATPDAYSRRPSLLAETAANRFLPFTDTDAYRNIKVATEAFVMANCGVFSEFSEGDADYLQGQISLPEKIAPDILSQRLTADYLQPVSTPGGDVGVLPYLAIIRRKLVDQRIKDRDIGDVMLNTDRNAPSECYGLLRRRLTCPCFLELIWSYWQEEGMLVQTMNALARRFQNIRGSLGNDPLANMEIDPLRSLNNVIWGYIQDEQHRLTVVRRNYEYDHHYGLRLAGRAVREIRTADSRSKFLEAFHTLLSITSAFYKRDDDTTIVADGFPVLNGLKEAHLILTQGAHNQYGDLPSTSRIEMLMQQWILARPEFREFLPTRIMVAYPEPWMDRVDAMKKLQGWTDTSVLHFRNLAIFGEQVLLSIRYGALAGVNDPVQGSNWARYWRPEIQGYVHAYRSVTGVDLSVDVSSARIDATLPSMHLVQRLTEQQRSA